MIIGSTTLFRKTVDLGAAYKRNLPNGLSEWAVKIRESASDFLSAVYPSTADTRQQLATMQRGFLPSSPLLTNIASHSKLLLGFLRTNRED